MKTDWREEWWKTVYECDPADIMSGTIRLVSDEDIDRLLDKQRDSLIEMIEKSKLVKDYEDGVHRWSHMRDMWGEEYASRVNKNIETYNSQIDGLINKIKTSQ